MWLASTSLGLTRGPFLVLTNDSPLDWTTEEVHGIAESARKARAEDVKVESGAVPSSLSHRSITPPGTEDADADRGERHGKGHGSRRADEPTIHRHDDDYPTRGLGRCGAPSDENSRGRSQTERGRTRGLRSVGSGARPSSSIGRRNAHTSSATVWYLRPIRAVVPVVRDRLTGDTFSVPDDHLGGALRTFASINRIDITGRENIAISAPSPGSTHCSKAVLGKDPARKARAAIGQD